MSNINVEKDRSLSETLHFAIQQYLKGIHTVLPGVIESFDHNTNRAQCRIAIDILKTNGEIIPQVIISDIPLIWPATKYGALRLPIGDKEPVLLLFSERGINSFKKTYKSGSRPDEDSFFDLHDAVAIPGFGTFNFNPINDGIVMQDNAGDNYIQITNSEIKIKSSGDITLECDDDIIIESDSDVSIGCENNISIVGNGKVTISQGDSNKLELSGGKLKHKNKDIGSSHTHRYVYPLHPSPSIRYTNPPR